MAFFAAVAISLGQLPQAGAILIARDSDHQADADDSSKNPIRKVVNLLQQMVKTVEEEGEKEEELYKKYSCYCKTGTADLQLSISTNDAKVPAVQSDIEEAESAVARLRQEIAQHSADRSEANTTLRDSNALREKEHQEFVEESTALQSYVDALAKAIPAVSAGMAGTGLLQQKGFASTGVAILRKAANADGRLTDLDRSFIFTFIGDKVGGNSEAQRYVPGSTEIVGILKQMQEDFSSDLAEVTKAEAEANRLFTDLVASKTQEIVSLGETIEKKIGRAGDLEVDIVTMKQELTAAQAALVEDSKFLQQLETDCSTKDAEYNDRVKMRNEELVALHETIKILTDDDALELFKKALPGASFVQVKPAHGEKGHRALQALMLQLGKGDSDRPEVQLLAYLLEGKKVDFSKVIKMIDDMVALLKQEQADDDSKKEYCNGMLDKTADKVKHLETTVSNLEMTIQDHAGEIETLEKDLKVLEASLAELDKLVTEATEQRKAEHDEFVGLMSENSAAKKLLQYAKGRLNEFYAAKKKAPQESADGMALLQKSSGRRIMQQPEAPKTWEGDYKKSEGSAGVLQMLDLLIRDLDKEMAVAKTDEDHAQKDYEDILQRSARKRAQNVKEIGLKQNAKANREVSKTDAEGQLNADTEQLQMTRLYEGQLHGECDWLLQNHDLRRTARADEIDGLKDAKAVLSGADFAFAQSSASAGKHL